MGSMGHVDWREIDQDEYMELLPAVIALVEADDELLHEPAPERYQYPFELMVREGARGEREIWVGVDFDTVCVRCGAFMFANQGGEYIAIVGGDSSCPDAL